MTDDRNIQLEDIDADESRGDDVSISLDLDGEAGSNATNPSETATESISAVSNEEAIVAPVDSNDFEHLVQEVANDPGAPFTPEAVASLAKLR